MKFFPLWLFRDMKFFPLWLFLLFLQPLQAAEPIDIPLPDGEEISLVRYPADSQTLVLWLPSENGFGSAHVGIADGLAANGIEVWVAQLHDSLMLTPGRQSLAGVGSDTLLPLLDRAQARGFRRVYILSSGRGAVLALNTAYLWQQRNPDRARMLGGLILLTPHLLSEKVVIGEEADYLPITGYSNLPIYMIIPELSTKYARSREIAERLQQGGSPVFVHQLRGIHDGFQERADEDLKAVDIAMRGQLPRLLQRAIGLLDQVPAAPLKAGWTPREKIVESSFRAPRLYPIAGENPPPLRLKTLDGRLIDLNELRGQVVLVNFWATWCAPCVEEIPSLSRLVERMKGRPFRVLAVNIGEQPVAIRRFLERIPVAFDILLDPGSRAVRDWKVYAYPSSFVIDRLGRLRYGYRGALAWDAPDIVETIKSMF